MTKKQHPSRRSPGNFGKTAVILALPVLILACLAAWLWSGGAAFPRLEVAGHRISQEEYLRVMYQARNDVLSDHSEAGISLRDWSAETALGDPRQMTMERTLAILSEYYAVSTLAVERGYLADAGYDAMLQDMEDINRQRQEAMESGAVITGFPQFTVADYITYRASSLRLQFTDDSANPENQVTEEEILRRYEADRDRLYLQPDSLVLQFLEERCKKVNGSGTKAKALYESFKGWCRQNGYYICSAKKFNAGLEAHPEWHSGKYVSGGYPVYGDVELR